MKFPRRRFLRLAAGAAALPAVPSAPALGQGTIIPTNAPASVYVSNAPSIRHALFRSIPP